MQEDWDSAAGVRIVIGNYRIRRFFGGLLVIIASVGAMYGSQPGPRNRAPAAHGYPARRSSTCRRSGIDSTAPARSTDSEAATQAICSAACGVHPSRQQVA